MRSACKVRDVRVEGGCLVRTRDPDSCGDADPDHVDRPARHRHEISDDRCGAEAGHLVIFYRGDDRSWEEKLFRRVESAGGADIHVWGM